MAKYSKFFYICEIPSRFVHGPWGASIPASGNAQQRWNWQLFTWPLNKKNLWFSWSCRILVDFRSFVVNELNASLYAQPYLLGYNVINNRPHHRFNLWIWKNTIILRSLKKYINSIDFSVKIERFLFYNCGCSCQLFPQRVVEYKILAAPLWF